MNTSNFTNLIADIGARSHQVEAYAWLLSETRLSILASKLSQATGLRFRHRDDFEECEAYVASVADHDFTLLQPKDEKEKDGRIDVSIEPGQTCELEGISVHFTSQFVDWLNANASDVGKFMPME